jgi:hypothetical protein
MQNTESNKEILDRWYRVRANRVELYSDAGREVYRKQLETISKAIAETMAKQTLEIMMRTKPATREDHKRPAEDQLQPSRVKQPKPSKYL